MRAWRVHSLGDPVDVLALDDVDEPEPGPGEVVITVSASGLNFPDILLCQGRYQEKPALPFTPGLEVSGTIAALGDGADGAGLRVGQRVAALPRLPRGGLAERVVANVADVFPIPDSLGDASAAALLITYQTGWFGLFRRAALHAGETLLVHAGAGGVGSAAIQLGRAAGAVVIATAGGAEKVEICRRLGADVVIDYRAVDFVDAVKDATDGNGADVVYDPVGGDTFDRSRRCVAWEGRLLVIGFAGGRIQEIPGNHVLLKNYSVVGLHWGAYRAHDPALVAHCHEELMRMHREGSIDPLVMAERPLADAPAALVSLGDRATYGKLVLVP